MCKKLPLQETFYEWYNTVDEKIFQYILGFDDIAEYSNTKEYIEATLKSFFGDKFLILGGREQSYKFDIETSFNIDEEVVLYGEIRNFEINCKSKVRKIIPPLITFDEVNKVTERELIEKYYDEIIPGENFFKEILFDEHIGKEFVKIASLKLSQWTVVFEIFDFDVKEKI
jgi:hypothetical protein